jgi:hypothetical protein
MWKGFLVNEEMRKYLIIYEEDVTVCHIRLCNRSRLNFLIYEENLISFLSVWFDTSLADSLACQALGTVSKQLSDIGCIYLSFATAAVLLSAIYKL